MFCTSQEAKKNLAKQVLFPHNEILQFLPLSGNKQRVFCHISDQNFLNKNSKRRFCFMKLYDKLFFML